MFLSLLKHADEEANNSGEDSYCASFFKAAIFLMMADGKIEDEETKVLSGLLAEAYVIPSIVDEQYWGYEDEVKDALDNARSY